MNAPMNDLRIRFDGKAVVVTGAGKGIGRDLCKLLVGCGATVAAVSRTKADLDSLAAEIAVHPIAADLADATNAARAAEEALKRLGRIDGLVNNAGVSFPQPFLETTPKAFDDTMAVNVRAALLVSQAAARDMIARKVGGAIVNVSSQASSVGIADHAAYCASKGALDQLTRTMALELGPHQIRVNAVNPTVTLTPMGEMAWGDPRKSEPMLAKIPLGRFALPRQVSHAIAYLLSDASDMVHGVTLPVDGGFLAV